MRAILVSVNYADILAVTLPYNRHHFDEVWVVTNLTDTATWRVATDNRCCVYRTDAFYTGGAVFNKWKALEEGLDVMGRRGWLCLMDADVLWTKSMKFLEGILPAMIETRWMRPASGVIGLMQGYLYTPMRRMWASWPIGFNVRIPGDGIPPESRWCEFPLHPQQKEFAGYTQIFHADDPALGSSPWHQTDWIHAGGADSFFQEKWPADRKIRPPFEVLHLGEAGQNWFGRTEEGRRKCAEIWKERAARKRRGLDPFEPEKIVQDGPKKPETGFYPS